MRAAETNNITEQLSADPIVRSQQEHTQRDIGKILGTTIQVGMDGLQTIGNIALYSTGRIAHTVVDWGRKAARGARGLPYDSPNQ